MRLDSRKQKPGLCATQISGPLCFRPAAVPMQKPGIKAGLILSLIEYVLCNALVFRSRVFGGLVGRFEVSG